MYLFHKACHLSTAAITEISCHLLFVHSQDLALLLLINLVASEQLLRTLGKDFSQGAPEPRNSNEKSCYGSFSHSTLVARSFILVNIYLQKESEQNRKASLFA